MQRIANPIGIAKNNASVAAARFHLRLNSERPNDTSDKMADRKSVV